MAQTCSNLNGRAVLISGSAAPARSGHPYTAFSGTDARWIHALSGIWSHTGGQVSGSVHAGVGAISAIAKLPATINVTTNTRIRTAPIRAQS